MLLVRILSNKNKPVAVDVSITTGIMILVPIRVPTKEVRLEWEKVFNDLIAAAMVEIMLNGTKSASTKIVAKVRGWRRASPIIEGEAEEAIKFEGLWHFHLKKLDTTGYR